MTNTKRKLKLSFSKNWDAWLSVVRTKITKYSIWNFIDSFKNIRSIDKLESSESDIDTQRNANFNEKHARYKIASSKYKKKFQDWKKQKNFMTKIINHIYDTTSITNLSFIQIVEIHSWIVLRAFKARFALFDSTRNLKLKQQYNRMIKNSFNRQSIDVWLNDYLKMLTLVKQTKIVEIIDNKRAYRDFLHAIEKTALIFVEIYELQLNVVTNHETQFLVLVEIFRHHMRMKKARKKKETIFNSTFAADESKNTNSRDFSNTSSFREQTQSRDLCYCEKKHLYDDYFYINEKIRSNEFTLKSEIVTKIDEAKKNSKKKRQLEQSIKRSDEKRQKKNENKSTKVEVEFFVVIHVNVIKSFTSDSSFSSNYFLRFSWIMNHDFDIHVVNNTMKQRFQKKRDCTDEFMMMSDMKSLFILAYDRMRINVNTFTEKKSMKFLNVSYVFDFMINIVANNILANKELHFDTTHDHLHRNDTSIVLVSRINAHYVLENNKSEKMNIFVVIVRQESIVEWHQLLAHASNDAIQHLQEVAEEMKLTNKNKMLLTNKCEECALFKAHKIVFKFSAKSEISDKSFYRIIYDLIDMTTTLNKHKWISHVRCFETDFHMIYTHESKDQITKMLIRIIHIIETKYEDKIVFVRSDDERALNTEWDNYCAFKDITHELSVVDTSAQNDQSERLDDILLTKFRAMRFEANLSVYLWSWINETIDYIMNRTLFKKHEWKTSFEMTINKKSNFAYIIQYEAKAYSLNKNISKKKKMRIKTHIDFLVDYDSINIFLIWISSQRKVIRTRDVTFDENSRYRSNEIDLIQLINESFLTNDTLDISQSDFTKIVNIESNSEKESWKLVSTDSIINRDAKKSFNRVIENDSEQEYLFSFASFSSRDENISNTIDFTSSVAAKTVEELLSSASSLKTTKSKHWAKTTIDEINIQSEKIIRIRKSNSLRNFNHYIALENAFAEEMRSFYETFMISMTKEKRSHRDDLLVESKFYHQMLKHIEIVDFLRIIDVKIKTLQSKQIWKKISWNHVKQAKKISISITWIFKYKFDNENYLIKHKIRLCARENFQQIEQDVYAVTLAIRIFRALMIIITVFDLSTRQYDAVNVFANSDIDEFIYCKSSDEWKKTSNVLLFLLKALYELKQSSALWYRHLSITLNKLNLEQMSSIECLFMCDYMILFFFVNDIAIMYYSQYFKQIDVFEKKLFEVYEMKNIDEIEWFLNIRITRDRKQQTTSFCQNSYIDKLISKFNINMNKKKSKSSIVNYISMIKNENNAISQKIHMYQQKIDSINFVATTTRSDVIAAVSLLSEYLTNSSKHHAKQATRTLEYLTHIKYYVIVYKEQANHAIIIFLNSSDASFANDLNTRQSSNEYCFMLYDDLIDWKITKQKIVIINFIEIELLIMSMIVNIKMWWDRFFDSIKMNMKKSTHIECDNRQIIRAFTMSTTKLIIKLRHVNIHRHWLRQKIQKDTINIQWTPTASILANDFIKTLPPQKHKKFVKLIELERISIKKTSKEKNESSQSEVE